MQTLWHKNALSDLSKRVERLQTDMNPKWGKFTCLQMLAHLNDGARMALGDLPVAAKSGPLRIWPLNYLVIYWLPWPKGAPTAPELLARKPEPIDQEKSVLVKLMQDFTKKDRASSWPDHPVFGKLSADDWGVLIYRHIDHHLTQFGV